MLRLSYKMSMVVMAVKSVGDRGNTYGKCGGHVPRVPRVRYCKVISGRCAKAVVTVHCRNESTAPISKCTVGCRDNELHSM